MKVSQSGKILEFWKFLQVQLEKPSSAMMKLSLMRTTTGKEDPELPLLQMISSLDLPASEISAQINASQISSKRHNSTSTVQRRPRESGIRGWISAKKESERERLRGKMRARETDLTPITKVGYASTATLGKSNTLSLTADSYISSMKTMYWANVK